MVDLIIGHFVDISLLDKWVFSKKHFSEFTDESFAQFYDDNVSDPNSLPRSVWKKLAN